ncbi:OLC1v1013168C1 [Oldenlandia corymbosa var. corymbosa]|uniref:OLC1v1013168C1 n=1 Tax=Oldenlandia corymbosa var. corymbosa TaxID=529605 RepID=A0AAV1DY05_OLDCO|nr:OLC1v1013168C1 [Oldenlandia corymbosa var. corymbosa]
MDFRGGKQHMVNHVENSLQHLDTIVEKHTSEEVAINGLQLQVSIEAAKCGAFQGVPFRGHDESQDSKNRGNFIELVKFIAKYNKDVAKVILHNAPQNAQYTSPIIQKEILSVFPRKVQNFIREEIY